MKRFKYIILIPLLAFLTSCQDDVQNPAFASDEIPRVYGWSTFNKYFIDIKDTLNLAMKVSPNDNATYKWFVDDVAVGHDIGSKYKFNDTQTYKIRFEVERNGVKNSRQADVIVTKPFVPKAYAKKVV